MDSIDKNEGLVYNVHNVGFDWNEVKNKFLQKSRGVSFEQVVELVSNTR